MVRIKINEFDLAIDDATKAIELNPKNQGAYGTRGWARFQKGDTQGAPADLKK